MTRLEEAERERTAMADRNCLSYWFPLIRDAGLPVPRTEIVRTDVDLLSLLDGPAAGPVRGLDEFIAELGRAVSEIGTPCFLRTGHTSGKHGWPETCHVPASSVLMSHVGALIEESACAGLFGLPTHVWVVRELIPTAPLFFAFQGMPITREFRVFARGNVVEHIQPYWPPDAIERPDRPVWRGLLDAASQLGPDDRVVLLGLARAAATAAGRELCWSVDLLQDRGGSWWITDMAKGEDSFRWGESA